MALCTTEVKVTQSEKVFMSSVTPAHFLAVPDANKSRNQDRQSQPSPIIENPTEVPLPAPDTPFSSIPLQIP
jgi:hypothetical protein